MKFHSKDFITDKKYIHLLPSVEIVIDEYIYMCHNFSIRFHWLIFHTRLMWMEDEE